MSDASKKVLILGTRGIPASHGGFETFAERLALFLAARGWEVTVYCQRDVARVRQRYQQDRWNGVERIHVEVGASGPKGTLIFDWLCVRHAATRSGICLVLGYNGAVFLPYLRFHNRMVVTNMDGLEWRRPKWNLAVRSWFYVNEWIAAKTSHLLVADHPEIARHLATRRASDAIVTVPYGADPVTSMSDLAVRAMGLVPDQYLLSICRIEPDNSMLTIIRAFSRKIRRCKLVVVGALDESTRYGKALRKAASDEVVFPGPIYDGPHVQALRFHARAYLHGHQVGGTNPSLVEALWAGNAVVAHDNPFNRWTADAAGLFFGNEDECAERMETVLNRPEVVAQLRTAARVQATAKFRWPEVLTAYEQAFLRFAPPETGVPRSADLPLDQEDAA